MNEITIKTQKEFDELPNEFAEFTRIYIRSNEVIRINRKILNSSVEARNNSSVEAYDNSSVVAWDNSSVVARNNSYIVAWDNSSVVAWDNSSVEAWGNSSVEAYDNSSVVAWDNSSVVARNNSYIVAWDNSSVEAYDNSSVVARNNSYIVAWDNSSVEAYDNSSVVARNNSYIVAWGNSSVEAYDNSSVEARNNSSVEAYDNSSVVARNNSSVDLFISSYALVVSRGVKVNRVLDYSTVVFKGCPVNIGEWSATSCIREIPRTIDPPFEEWLRRGYIKADGILKKLKSQKKIGEVEVFECEEFGKSESSFVVKKNGLFSHGETVEKAIEDLRYKIGDRNASEFEGWRDSPDQQLSIDEAIAGYRVITGACEFGTKEFVNSTQIPEKLTPNVIMKITEGRYGYDLFRSFLKA